MTEILLPLPLTATIAVVLSLAAIIAQLHKTIQKSKPNIDTFDLYVGYSVILGLTLGPILLFNPILPIKAKIETKTADMTKLVGTVFVETHEDFFGSETKHRIFLSERGADATIEAVLMGKLGTNVTNRAEKTTILTKDGKDAESLLYSADIDNVVKLNIAKFENQIKRLHVDESTLTGMILSLRSRKTVFETTVHLDVTYDELESTLSGRGVVFDKLYE